MYALSQEEWSEIAREMNVNYVSLATESKQLKNWDI